MGKLTRGALLVAALLLAVASAAGAKPKPKPPAPAAKHFFVIMLENHSKSSVLGDANAPYISSLAGSYAVAANYFGVTHPSEPNYVAAISGSNWFVNDDNPANRFNHTNTSISSRPRS
ncbi:MAG TPA: alkaline phosphatase family protein [Gaiellaceae bacterium]|nr:alkaline phosphatase family protein [Gaiellaceae bacterium]